MTDPVAKEDIVPLLLTKKEPLTSLENIIIRSELNITDAVLEELKKQTKDKEISVVKLLVEVLKLPNMSLGLKSDPEEDDGFEDCECGYSHHYEDKCPTGTQTEHYESWK